MVEGPGMLNTPILNSVPNGPRGSSIENVYPGPVGTPVN
jgi:hypothetical protein